MGAAPIAFLMEAAGGLAVGGAGERILDIEPTNVHQRVPCFFVRPTTSRRCVATTRSKRLRREGRRTSATNQNEHGWQLGWQRTVGWFQFHVSDFTVNAQWHGRDC